VPKQLTSRIDLGGRVEVTEKPLLDFDSKRGYLVRVARISLTMRPAPNFEGGNYFYRIVNLILF
jgi:hypothetical protein